LIRIQHIKSSFGWIPVDGFRKRRAFYLNNERGVLVEMAKAQSAAAGQMGMNMDPAAMMQQQKSMFTMIIPQMLMMGVVNYFFSGFVVGNSAVLSLPDSEVKIPFALSSKFKIMTQRGVDLSSLDSSYVSSFSWYILVSVGIQGIIQLLLGRTQPISEAELMQAQMNAPTMDMSKIFVGEREALEVIEHKQFTSSAEERILNK
jgi:ER membrane protein complex subunit 3